jgi:hypothetical protein
MQILLIVFRRAHEQQINVYINWDSFAALPMKTL